MPVRRAAIVPSSRVLAVVSAVAVALGVLGSPALAGAQPTPVPVPAAAPVPMGMAVVVHGLVDFPADVYLDGAATPALSGFEFRRVTEPVALPVGVHRADLRRAGEAPTAVPTLSGSFVVAAGQRVTVAALLDAKGKPSWLAFPDDATVRDGALGELRLRHFAAAGPVSVSVDGAVVLEGAANLARAGQSAPIVVAPGRHRVAIIDQATGATVVPEQEVTVTAGGAANLYLTGTAERGLALLQEGVEPPGPALGRLQAVPSSVPGGNSGLAASASASASAGAGADGPVSTSFLAKGREVLARGAAAAAGAAVGGSSAPGLASPGLAASVLSPGVPVAPAGLPPVGAVTPAPWGGMLPAGALAVGARGAEPRRVRIPAIGLDAPVVAANVRADGALGLPDDAVRAAWFDGGALPGQSGSSVIAAHVDFNGAEGVFFRLGELPAGSLVEIERADGSSEAFRTSGGAQRHAKSSLPLDELFRRGGAPVLRLVTCGGVFDPSTRSYRDNVVVEATPLGDLGQPGAGDQLVDAA